MPKRSYELATDSPEIEAAFNELRRQLKVSLQVPAEVLVEAEAAAHAPRLPEKDETDIPFVTLDPASSMDLDQAFHIERDGDGYRVRYAIADVAAFVEPGGPMDVEAHERGETLYAPDQNVRLYPPVLSEEERQKFQETMLEFAKCMREHGVDMPDPDIGEGGRGVFRAGPGKQPGAEASKPFEEAEKACQPILRELRDRAQTDRAGS